jgi:hypothetical protein
MYHTMIHLGKEVIVKKLFCRTITPQALKLIRFYEGDLKGDQVIICHNVREEPSHNNKGHIVEGAFRIFFPNEQAICYTLTGEISFVSTKS